MTTTKPTTAEEAIAQAIADLDGDTTDFEGMNCNDYLDEDEPECLGWDGISRRCECGNRRVSWEAYRVESTGEWVTYGVAY